MDTILERGNTYDVYTRFQSGNGRWVERVMRARYLWRGTGVDEGSEVFDGRPQFGTCPVPRDTITDCVVVEPGARPHGPRRPRGRR